MIKEKKDNEVTKQCPNPTCHFRFPISGRKCPQCGVFFEKFLRDNPPKVSEPEEPEKWTPNLLYDHVPSLHSQKRHTTRLLDPLLGNPNSKLNILALTHHLKDTGEIGKNVSKTSIPPQTDGEEREQSRQWIFVSADAAIALQVSTFINKISLI